MRYGVEFAEGFEIFRSYRAKAVAGSWMLQESGDMYPSLNELVARLARKRRMLG